MLYLYSLILVILWFIIIRNQEGKFGLFKVNVIGTLNVIRFACQLMAENEKDEAGQRGVIINTSSIAAFDGQIGQVSHMLL